VLRHTFCTHLADAGADVGVIRELAGHADIRTTTIYTAVNDERLEDAIAGRRRDRLRLAQLDDDWSRRRRASGASPRNGLSPPVPAAARTSTPRRWPRETAHKPGRQVPETALRTARRRFQ
jgi:hypothetical protein